MVSVLICVAAIWLTQRLLTMRQVMIFRKQLLGLKSDGRVSVGMAKKIGRRVYVGLAFDPRGVVNGALVLRGATVFAKGRARPDLLGRLDTDLASGRTPAGLPPMVATAAVQAAGFMAAARKRERSSGKARSAA
jgi:DNA-binding transcriptional regulator of glucitol operon